MVNNIIKINSKSFPSHENIFIDTNVLYWLTYANSRAFPTNLKPQKYQLEDYPLLFEKLLAENNKLYFSNYSTPELFSIIAKIESTLDGCGNGYQRKKWLRKNGRELVYGEMKTVISTVDSWAKPLEQILPLKSDQYLKRYNEVYLDGYDLYIDQEIAHNDISFVLTDDIDFKSINGLKVITANRQY